MFSKSYKGYFQGGMGLGVHLCAGAVGILLITIVKGETLLILP